jgi:hypothetical protein
MLDWELAPLFQNPFWRGIRTIDLLVSNLRKTSFAGFCRVLKAVADPLTTPDVLVFSTSSAISVLLALAMCCGASMQQKGRKTKRGN